MDDQTAKETAYSDDFVSVLTRCPGSEAFWQPYADLRSYATSLIHSFHSLDTIWQSSEVGFKGPP